MRGRLLVWGTVFLMLTGCGRGLPQGREMEDAALMRTMGVDAGDREEDLLVTVSTARRAKGLQGEEQSALILSAQRPSLSGACLAMQGLSDSYVFYGHVDQVLLGEEVVQQGRTAEILEYLSQEDQFGLGIQVWMIRGNTARNAIQTGKDQGVHGRLSSLREDGEMGVAGLNRTAGEVLTDLLENKSAYLPVLALNEGEDTSLLESGYGVLNTDGLAGWLTGKAARGLELLQQRPGAELLELNGAAVRLTSSSLTCVPVMERDRLVGLELDLRLLTRIEEWRKDGLNREELEGQVQERAREQVETTMEQLQQWNADCLSLKRMAGAARPEFWRDIRRQWEERFPNLEIQVRCTAAITNIES